MNLENAVPKQKYVLENGLIVRIFQVKNGIEPMVWAQPDPPHPNIRMLEYSFQGKLRFTYFVPNGDDISYDITSEVP